ncbi:MAG: Glycosyl transferase group 1 [Rhodospirillaceae bacterium]|nr:MAG: Glycosyl transferase group 1 [Rhodospirillaceae bacterium]
MAACMATRRQKQTEVPDTTMKVVVAVPGRFHGFDLARVLHGQEVLARFLTTCPAFVVRRSLSASAPFKTAGWLEVGRWLHRRLHLPGEIDPALATAFARFVAHSLPDGGQILVVWSGAALEAITAARTQGMKVVLERSTPHVAYQTEIRRRTYKRFDLVWPGTSPRLVARELAEYEAVDAIAVPTRFVAETFMRRGIPKERLIVNPYGVDLSRFVPLPLRRDTRPLRILFTGRVGVCKGVPWLLRAFARLDLKAELHLVGPLDPGMDRVLRHEPMERVVLHGLVPDRQLPAYYTAADIFCLPSLEEGLPVGVVQAMACGLPVVATTESGAADILRDGIDGRIVPSGNPPALAAALEELAADPLLRQTIGDRARRAVSTGYDWTAYGRRATAAYERVLRGA